MKAEMDIKIEQFKIKRKELEKESIDWTELVERTFNFAKYASEVFKNSNLEKKRNLPCNRLELDSEGWKTQCQSTRLVFAVYENQGITIKPSAKVGTDQKRHQLREK